MPESIITVQQNIYKSRPDEYIDVIVLKDRDLTVSLLEDFLLTAGDSVGIAAAFDRKCVLSAMAIASSTLVLHIQLTSDKKSKKGRTILHEKILCNNNLSKLAFDMDRVSIALHHDYQLHIADAIDLQSLVPKSKSRQASDTIFKVLGGENPNSLNTSAALDAFLGNKSSSLNPADVALRAWASGRARYHHELAAASRINTAKLNQQHLATISKIVRDLDRLYALKPTKVKNDVKADFSLNNKGQLNVELTRFKTRLRTSNNQKVVLEMQDSRTGAMSAQGQVRRVEGRQAFVQVNSGSLTNAKIKSVYTIGKEEFTSAEQDRIAVVLSILQGISTFFRTPIVQKIFSPSRSAQTLGHRRSLDFAIEAPGGRALNPSQEEAIQMILSEHDNDAVGLIHGPPGTGKTTVIATTVINMISGATITPCKGIWLVAQSNVAVKNIAEKLASLDFVEFKILVSKDFHFDWHEHLYHKIEHNIIRSDDFSNDPVGSSRLLLGSKVILCTLSMFSHPRLPDTGFTRIVPVETVIVDEASQIELGDYLPLWAKFGKGIKKMIFIGDDKQLAPYGQDDLGDLKSIFEIEHLRKRAVFLDTQYRMPGCIGGFISHHVYNGKLKTVHKNNKRTACRFVDIRDGKEDKSGHSWKNEREVRVAVQIARKFHAQGKSYRIITPYDAQRNLLEQALKNERLPWEDKCFNVDSFQGNEEEHIIISLVRSKRVGFLKNLRRTNVMLTRCKQSMIICTSRAFLSGEASKSLVGILAAEYNGEPGVWLSTRDVLAGRI